ncbi:MAG: acyl-CoA reductase [Dehalococcoidales bacterium]|nr:acyl-CoA reductase [Dehalococcoidales bacterium]
MERLCREHNLLNNDSGVVRMPFLVKGKLVAPPEISKQQIEGAFNEADEKTTCVKLPEAQVVREPVIDRKSMKYTGEYVYQVMPQFTGAELIETDTDKLALELYDLSVEDILDYLEKILHILLQNNRLAVRVRELCRLTSEYPDAFLNGWFASFHASFSREAARQMIDTELSFQGKPGGNFLNGWVEVPAHIAPGWLHLHARNLFGEDIAIGGEPSKSYVRAMPTRQLHITAGNAPEVPLVSALRAVLTKSAAVIKLPYGATLTGALFALAAFAAAPEHPITKNLSMVYWPGGDEGIENVLFMPGAFGRIVVWGNPETVASIQSRALFTRVICLNPRYGVSLIGREAFGNLEEAAVKSSLDVMLYNQKACTSSLLHYIEGTETQAAEYAKALCRVLGKWEKEMPNFVSPAAIGQLKRMKRGRYANARWYINKRSDDFSSGVTVIPGEFDILDHPMCRLVMVRPVAGLDEALKHISQYVSTAGVYPEKRQLELRDRILARGVSNVFPLGQCERVYAGMPHDGMRVLSELVDWKNG